MYYLLSFLFMRIAFVGKGGSGKTTLSTLFTLFLDFKKEQNIYFVDADLNKNAATQFGIDTQGLSKLGDPQNQLEIRKWLIGKREDIPGNDMKYFKKTTPPRKESNILKIEYLGDIPILSKYFLGGNIKIAEIGEYSKDLVAKNCYHGSLSILENILSHLDDRKGWLISDMVAGTDAFVGALFVQFDLIFIVAEPTRNSKEVVNQFVELAVSTGTESIFKIVGNKIEDDEDIDYLKTFTDQLECVASLRKSKYLKKFEMSDQQLSVENLETENFRELEKLYSFAKEKAKKLDVDKRLNLLRKWHHKVAMDHTGEDRMILLDQISDEKVFD